MIRIGLVQSMFRDVQPGLAASLARPFKSLMEQQTGINGDVELVTDVTTMAEKIQAGKLEVGLVHGFEFAWVKDRYPDLEPIAAASPYGRSLHGCVVVHQSSKATSLADLKDENVTIPKGIKAHCLLYFDQLRKDCPVNVAKPDSKSGLSTEEVLNSLAGCNCSAALVDGGAFAGYERFQPGAAKQLKVLCKSDSFPPSVIFYKKGSLNEDVVSRLRNGLLSAERTPQYKPLLLLWNLNGFELPAADYSAQLNSVLKQYPAPQPVTQILPVKREK